MELGKKKTMTPDEANYLIRAFLRHCESQASYWMREGLELNEYSRQSQYFEQAMEQEYPGFINICIDIKLHLFNLLPFYVRCMAKMHTVIQNSNEFKKVMVEDENEGIEPTEKSPGMEAFLENLMGRSTAIKNKRCTCCERPIDIKDFHDEMSVKEYRISGLCQWCQDDVFNE
jgi:hypothetical protein